MIPSRRRRLGRPIMLYKYPVTNPGFVPRDVYFRTPRPICGHSSQVTPLTRFSFTSRRPPALRQAGRHGQRAALHEVLPAHVPHRPSVAVVELVARALDGDRVADQRLVEQPSRVRRGHIDTAV